MESQVRVPLGAASAHCSAAASLHPSMEATCCLSSIAWKSVTKRASTKTKKRMFRIDN